MESTQPPKSESNTPKAIVFFVLALIALGSYVGSFYFFKSSQIPSNPDVVIPVPNVPPIAGSGATSSFSSSIPAGTSLPLLNEYRTSQNPFSDADYQKVPRIIYKGDFKKIIAEIKGSVIGSEEIMLMFNFGQETGIINGARTSQERINIQGTRNLGGIFAPATTFTSEVNLLNDMLGASSNNLQNCDVGRCSFEFINSSTKIAQVAPILVVPVTLNGSYGGAVINDFHINYECQDGINGCKIQVCEQGMTVYDCVKKKYGKEEADAWYTNYLQNSQK
jgi:hypothetical protein